MDESAAHIDAKSAELESFLDLTSWSTLSNAIRGSRKFKNNVTAGGVRLIKKNRKRLQKIVKKTCLENDSLLSALFSEWFNSHTVYYSCLKPYFESDDHETQKIEQECEPHEYVVNDEYFKKFIEILNPSDAGKFLLLSPIKFTEQQKIELQKIADNENDEVGVVESERDSSGGAEISTKKSVVLTRGEWKFHNNELKKSVSLNQKLGEKISKLKDKVNAHKQEKAELKKGFQHEADELNDIINNVSMENEDLQAKVESLSGEIDKLNNRIEEKANRVSKLEQSLVEIRTQENRYFAQILDRLDVEELLEGINAPNDIVELLSTVIRPPSTDDSAMDHADISLKKVWRSMVSNEGRIVRNLLELSAKGVADFSSYKDWDQQVDDFLDLKCSLSARIYLIDMFYEILRLNLAGKDSSQEAV